jgi:hypothetical protein
MGWWFASIEFWLGGKIGARHRCGYHLDLLATASQIARGLSPGNGWWFTSIEFWPAGKIGAARSVPGTRCGYLLDLLATASQIAQGLSPDHCS